MDWSFHETESEGRTLVRMAGDCDLYTAPRFKSEILKKMESGSRRILFDLSGIRYLDSTGVGAIICILQASKRMGTEVRFLGVAGTPRRVLEMSSILPLMRMEGAVRRELPTMGGTR